jgi:spermidine/putrescine transport system substrate-binding protein
MDADEGAARRLTRGDLLKLAAAAGGAGLVAGRPGVARAMQEVLRTESGRLQVLDWAGYGNDGGQAMFAHYVKQYPHNAPQFTYMTNEADALAKIHAGLKPDLFRPYVGWVKYFATSGLVQPWDTSLIPNFKHLNQFMVKAGQYNGKQYGIPDDWGFDAILYRTDKVKPKSNSWGLLYDDRYQGKIAWYDDPVENLTIAGLLFGFKDPWNQTDAEL